MENTRVIGAVYALNLKGEAATPRSVALSLGIDQGLAKAELGRLEKSGYLGLARRRVVLTPKGRRSIRVVFIGGGFEVIHRGHLHTIERARSLGDVLVVSVARDSTIRKRKRREPVSSETERVQLLSALRQVDAAILGVEGDIYETLERVSPDVVALGYDQHHGEEEIAKEAARRGLKLEVVRLDSPYPKVKTSELLRDY